MGYEALENEIRMLPESYISEISQFILYLKLKDRYSDFEKGNSYENALSKWRKDSASLFLIHTAFRAYALASTPAI